MKKIVIILILVTALFFTACSEKGVTLTFKASDPITRAVTIDVANNIEINRFILSIREVESKTTFARFSKKRRYIASIHYSKLYSPLI